MPRSLFWASPNDSVSRVLRRACLDGRLVASSRRAPSLSRACSFASFAASRVARLLRWALPGLRLTLPLVFPVFHRSLSLSAPAPCAHQALAPPHRGWRDGEREPRASARFLESGPHMLCQLLFLPCRMRVAPAHGRATQRGRAPRRRTSRRANEIAPQGGAAATRPACAGPRPTWAGVRAGGRCGPRPFRRGFNRPRAGQ